MKKLSYVYVCYGATLAIVLAVAALPYSSWAFKNHVDVLTGGWQISRSMFYTDSQDQVEPVRITRSWNLSGQDSEGPQGGYPWEQTLRAYIASAHDHPDDPAKLAHLIRTDFRAPHRAEDLSFKPPTPFWSGYTIGQAREEALWAAKQGAKIDPDNAYFASSEGILLDWKGQREDAYRALEDAARAHRYDEYADQEGDDRIAAIVSRWGYRGEKPRMEAVGTILLPHYASLKGWAREIAARPKTKENVQAQADMLQVAHTMERTEPFLIGTLVAMSVGNEILLPPAEVARLEQPDGLRSKLINLTPRVEQFNALQKKLSVDRPYDPSELARATPRIRSAAKEFDDFTLLPLTSYFSWTATAFPPVALLGVLLTVLFTAILFKMKPRGDTAQRIFPYAASIAVLQYANGMTPYGHTIRFFSPEYYWGLRPDLTLQITPWFMVTMSILGVAQIWPKLRRWSTVLAILVCVVSMFWSYTQNYLGGPALAYGVALLATRIKLRVGPPVLGFLAASFFGILTVGYINLAFAGPDQIFVAYVVAAASMAAALFFANGSRKLLLAMPVVTLLFALGYLGSVIREVKQNQEIKVGLDGWSREADLLRAKAGIQ